MNIQKESRTLILHYHFFKNAGTSLDKILKENFDDKWTTREFSGPAIKNRSEVENWIEANPDIVCFSSHTALLPPPEIEGIKIIPVLFVRHPIDRIASAYEFERKQNGSSFGSVLANNTTLSGYIKTRLSIANDFQCRNFHTQKLAEVYYKMEDDPLTKAVRAIESLPFIGLVNRFDASLKKLEELLINHGFKNLKFSSVQENVTKSRPESLNKRLISIENEIGIDEYKVLLNANSHDIKLYELVRNKYKV